MNMKIETVGIVYLDYRAVLPLQGDLKTLSKESENKLLASLQDKGKFVPEFVWRNPSDGKYYTMDGHSRLKIYLKNDVVFNGSYEIPFLEIQASDMHDAKEKLLLINSDYGKITRQGLLDFSKDLNISADWMNRHLDMSAFPSFNFVDESRKMQMNLSRDLLTPPSTNKTPEYPTTHDKQYLQNTQQLPRAEETTPKPVPRVSDNDFHSITEIVPYQFKLRFIEIRNRVMRENGFTQLHEAFQYIINKFNEIEYGSE